MDDLKQVQLPHYQQVPRWLIIQGEMDYRLFILEKMLGRDRAPIVKMIDKATGFDKQLETEALELIVECRWLKREYDAEVNDLAASDSKLSTDVANPPQSSETTQ